MTTVLAEAARGLRPGNEHLPLFVHVLGAMIMVGGFVLAFTSLGSSIRNGGQISRLGFRALLYGALPGYIVMRVGAQWIYDKEFPGNPSKDPSWIGIGFGVADGGLLLLLIALLLSGLGLRRARRGGGGGGLVTASTVLVALILVTDLIAIFAMTTKPA
jgi:hypothetical protein